MPELVSEIISNEGQTHGRTEDLAIHLGTVGHRQKVTISAAKGACIYVKQAGRTFHGSTYVTNLILRPQLHWRQRLSTPVKRSLAILETTLPMYHLFHIANNKITNKGCKNLSKARWNKIQVLAIGIHWDIQMKIISHSKVSGF